MDVVIIALVFSLAGAVKGGIGLGLPTVSLALLSVAIDLPSAMALLIVPSLVTNIWQSVVGKNTWLVFKRIWPFLFCATFTIWVGALSLTRIDTAILSALLGVLITAYAVLGLLGFRMTLSLQKEYWVGPIAGIVNGVLTGMTGSFVVPGVMYLQSLGLTRDALIQAMGMLFTVSTLALGIALRSNTILTPELSILSTLAVLPAIAGMYIGSKIKGQLSEQRFKRIFFFALFLLGIYLLYSSLLSSSS